MSFNLRNNFSKGVVDTDTDERYIEPNSLTKANNVDILSFGTNHVITSIKGNVLKGGAITVGDEYVGNTVWDDKIYLFYTTATDNYIREFNSLSGVFTLVVRNSLGIPLVGATNYDKFVLSADCVDGEFIYYTGGIRQADGEIEGNLEPKRIDITDAKANPTTYDNFSGNLDKPSQLNVSSRIDTAITNNLLKFGSYIFYKRTTNKYNEKSVISYPSNCISVTEGFGSATLDNTIDVAGFNVEDDVISVDILMTNDSTATFFIVKTIETVATQTVSGFSVTNAFEYPVLEGDISDIVNNDFPLTATEQEVVDNSMVYGDVVLDYDFVDDQGDPINKNTPFSYVSTGIDSATTQTFTGTTVTGNLAVVTSFLQETTYRFKIDGWVDAGGVAHIYEFNYTHSGGFYGSELDYLFSLQNSLFSVAADPGDHNFTVTDIDAQSSNSTTLTITLAPDELTQGLNTDFSRKGGLLFLDDNGRNQGVSNVTNIFYSGTELTFNVRATLGGFVTAPVWATNYMIVRDKTNTALSYSIIGVAVASSVKTGYNYHEALTSYYTDYLADSLGETITVYSKSLQKDIEIEVLTVGNKDDESATLKTSSVYFYVKDDITLDDTSLILFQPNKEVESTTEVFFETSDVFSIVAGVFGGDIKEKLNWYDTKVGFIDKTFATTLDDFAFPIMKTDFESLRDINHLGRGAYIVINEINVKGNTTLVHSQKYSPSTNYNGLSDFSFTYNNTVDLEKKYGSVEVLHFDDTDLLVGQRNKWQKILINKDLVTTVSGSSVLQVSDDFFNKTIPNPWEGGITDKQSFVVYGFRKYFVDENNGVHGRLSVDGVTVINGSRDFEINELINGQNPDDRIICGYDMVKQEYITCYTSQNRIFRFSEVNKNQVGEYALANPKKDYISLKNKTYSISSLDENLYQENVGTDNVIDGSKVDEEFTISVNQEPDTIKDFISLSLHSNLALDVEIETDDNLTTLEASGTDFEKKEDIWYADIFKDENASGGSSFGVGTYKQTVVGSTIETNSAPNNIRVGGTLSIASGVLGDVVSVTGNIIVLDALVLAPAVNELIFTTRDAKIEGRSIKGSNALMTFTNTASNPIKVFSVTTGVNISSHNDLQ